MIFEKDTYYVYVGGSCDYGHKERAGGGAYIAERDGKETARYVTADFQTTEFRMMLIVMLRLMAELEEGSSIVFLTNVAYLQNFDREPSEKSANADLIRQCIELKHRHAHVSLKIVPYHKTPRLIETHEMAHEAMLSLRNNRVATKP